MATKVIFADCASPLWLDVAIELQGKYGWEPCYWIGPKELEKAVIEKFPNVVFHHYHDAIRGVVPGQKINFKLSALDQTILIDLAYHESIIMNMMNRMDPDNSFSYQERVRLYHTQLRYWLTILNYYEPEVVVYTSTPHVVYDYVIYILCQRMGIKTILSQGACFDDLFYPLERIEDDPPAVSLYKELLSKYDSQRVKLSSAADGYLKRLQGDYTKGVPSYLKELLEKESGLSVANVSKKISSIFNCPKYFFNLLRSFYRPGKLNYLKRNGNDIKDSNWTDFEYKMYKFKANKRKKQYKIFYDKHAQKVDLKSPYIYVALQYQPEKSSSPDAGVYVNQFLIVDLLSKSVPDGWYIYVKESRMQNSSLTHGERGRTLSFYEDLISIPNVRLVHNSTSPWDLIDNAKASATACGTTGWETIVRGKPVLLFGYGWYRGCEGVLDSRTIEKCKEAIAKIEAGYQVDYNKVRLYVYALEQIGFRGFYSFKSQKISSVSYEQNIINITDAILRIYYKKPSPDGVVLV